MKLYMKLYLFIYSKVLYFWTNAFCTSIWNKYLESKMYKLRVKATGEKLAKYMFFSDPSYLYQSYRKAVFKDKKLMLRIILFPFSIEPNKRLTEYEIITSNDLWR